MGPGDREEGADEDLEAVCFGLREDVAGRALQHGHVRCLFRERGEEGDGGGPRADDDDVLAGVV